MGQIQIDDGALDAFWSQYPDIKEFVDNLNAVEHWVLDDVDNHQIDLMNWAESLDENMLRTLNEKGKELLIILGSMSSDRAIFVLNQLIVYCPPLISTLSTIAVQNARHKTLSKYSTIFLDRLTVTETQDVFKSIFDPNRLARVYASIKQTSKEVGKLND